MYFFAYLIIRDLIVEIAIDLFSQPHGNFRRRFGFGEVSLCGDMRVEIGREMRNRIARRKRLTFERLRPIGAVAAMEAERIVYGGYYLICRKPCFPENLPCDLCTPISMSRILSRHDRVGHIV